MIIYNLASDWKAVIEHFYRQEDEQWHTGVHENGGTADENIIDSLSSISSDAVMYQVFCNNELAAAFTKVIVADGLVMEFFHVAKKFRTREFFIEFWDVVNNVFGCQFYAGLFSQNVAAIKHLIKNGFDINSETVYKDKKVIIFKSSPCQYQQQFP